MTPGAFDARRLTLARWANELTKKELADRVGVSAASITQYEAGNTLPSPAIRSGLALACGVPRAYFERPPGRRRPDFSSRSFFRSLRSTSQRERDRADALAEHVVDLVEILDARIQLPEADLPSLPVHLGDRAEIEQVAEVTRREWNVPDGPIANVTRLLESRGVIVARLRSDGRKLDAFSRWFGDRPVVILWSDKSDKARSRFDAAHELGHLVMHSDADPLSLEQERQAHMFASAFLMPSALVAGDLIHRAPTLRSWDDVLRRRAYWGVSAKALLYRSREMGALPEVAFRRAMQNYNRHDIRSRDGVALGAPELPLLLSRAAHAADLDCDALAAAAALSPTFVADALGRDVSQTALACSAHTPRGNGLTKSTPRLSAADPILGMPS
jgi:Zn-dependent peptidase ImmA (M78 family)/transcriptional regulator with XRE-family HTH domain